LFCRAASVSFTIVDSPTDRDLTAVTTAAAVLHAMQRHPEAVQQFACGDQAAFDTLKNAALHFADGHFSEPEIADALTSKLREGL
jgi:hypothetical protein